jgi:N6-adenosine-specific RNA methylase IME4
VVRPDGRLVAGERRIMACKQLGWDNVPVTIIDIVKIARGEHDENIARKDFTWTEAVAIKREVEPEEKAAAKERQAAPRKGRKGKTGSGKLPEAVKGQSRDKAAKATGKKARTLAKAEAVVDAAEKQPERFGDLLARLDEDDAKVETIYRELKQRQARAEYESQIIEGCTVDDLEALAASGYRAAVIYADPAWEFEVYSGKGKQRSADRHYDTMTLDEIKAMPVGALAADNCALFLWGVWPEMPGALEVIKAWGFEYKTAGFVWVKEVSDNNHDLHWGMGYWTRANTEWCLLATKGTPVRVANDVHQVIISPVSHHSEKPEEVRRRIERLVVGPYLELFGRSPVKGWTVWGNQIPRDKMEAAE